MPWRRPPGSLGVTPTGFARPGTTRPQRRNGRRPSELAVPPDEHAASPKKQADERRPRPRPEDHPEPAPSSPAASSGARTSRPRSFQYVLERSTRTFDNRGESWRSPDPVSRRSTCVRPSVQWFGGGCIATADPSPHPGPLSDLRQSTRTRDGLWLPSRGNAAARSGGAATASRGTWRPRPGAMLPPARGHPRHGSSGRRWTIRTSEPDRVRPADP
jgi:hypothetical protein